MEKKQSYTNINGSNFTASKISIFPLKNPLVPSKVYEAIECKKSTTVIVSTTLCVHSREKDIHVSGSILGSGVWEFHILCKFCLKYRGWEKIFNFLINEIKKKSTI